MQPAVERLEEHRPGGKQGGDRNLMAETASASPPGVRDVLARAERSTQLDDAVAVCLAPESVWEQSLGLGPVACELPVRDRAREAPRRARWTPVEIPTSGATAAYARRSPKSERSSSA